MADPLKPAKPTVIVSLGEVLVEVMRPERGVGLERPGTFLGPFASGAPAIFAWASARLGGSVRFVGVRGDDPFGQLCEAHLTDAGVRTHLRVDPEHGTGVAFVAYREDGGRDFHFHLHHAAAAQLGPEDVTGAVLDGAAWLHVTGSSLGVSARMREAVYEAVRRAKARGVTVSFDPNVRPELEGAATLRERCAPVLAAADVVLPSGAEAALITGLDDPAEACRALLEGATTVLLKRGAAGCTLFTRGSVTDLPSIPITETDPTGAGDCFAAGFAVATLRGLGPHAAARFANAVGALSTTAFGPTSGTFTQESVESALRRNS